MNIFNLTLHRATAHRQGKRFVSDSPLEGNGFEPRVPRQIGGGFKPSLALRKGGVPARFPAGRIRILPVFVISEFPEFGPFHFQYPAPHHFQYSVPQNFQNSVPFISSIRHLTISSIRHLPAGAGLTGLPVFGVCGFPISGASLTPSIGAAFSPRRGHSTGWTLTAAPVSSVNRQLSV